METHDDIAMEILSFLLPKSLMRFKCVCKTWNILIRHPNFVQLHSARSQVRPSANRLLFQFKTNPGKRYDDKKSKLERFPLQIDYFCYNGEMTICSNNCNGLVCLYSYKDTQVYLYNITTRELKALPPSRIKRKRYDHPWSPNLFLGFDQVTESYKLLHVFGREEAKVAKIQTLGVTNSSWREIVLLDYKLCYFSKDCIFLNGVLYWTSSRSYVAYFNFSEEKFGKISPPPQSCFGRLSKLQTALWGKLAMAIGYIGHGNQVIYDDVNKDLFATRATFCEVMLSLLGAERIDETKGAHVLATASVISAPASLLSSSCSCARIFVSGLIEKDKRRPFLLLRFVSSYVENIIPLSSLTV